MVLEPHVQQRHPHAARGQALASQLVLGGWRVTSHRPQFCNYRISSCLHPPAALAASATRGKRAGFCVRDPQAKAQRMEAVIPAC